MARKYIHDFDYFTSKCTKCGLERRPFVGGFTSNGIIRKDGMSYQYRQEGSKEWLNSSPKECIENERIR